VNDLRIAILGGSGGSGSSLLTHLLSRHPRIASGPELGFFNHVEVYDLDAFRRHLDALFSSRRATPGYKRAWHFLKASQHYGLDRAILEAWLAESDSARELFTRLWEHITRRFERPWFVEKTPTNAYCFRLLAERFPDLPLVHILRDGRDVAASLRRRGVTLFEAGSRWLYDTLAARAAARSPRYLELRYEDLVRDPDATVGRAAAHLGLERVAGGLAGSAAPVATYDDDWNRKVPQRWHQTPLQPISEASVGSHRRELTAAELDTLSRIAITKRAAAELGAEVETTDDLLELLGYGRTGVAARAGIGRARELRLELRDRLRQVRISVRKRSPWPARLTRIAAP
jgi:hypothetical protein